MINLLHTRRDILEYICLASTKFRTALNNTYFANTNFGDKKIVGLLSPRTAGNSRYGEYKLH